MVQQKMTFLDPAFLLLSQFSECLPKMPSQLCIQRLPAILGNEHDVVFALPFAVNFIVIHRWDSFSCALAAHDSESRRWADGVDRRICQTFAASPAEPGELLLAFRFTDALAVAAVV